MFFYISLWMSLGFLGLIISRAITFKIENILGNSTKFWNARFFKINSYRVFYGPLYLMAILWDFLLNLDVFKNAAKIKAEQDQYKKNIEKLTSTLQVLGQQMTTMQSFLTLFGPKQDEGQELNNFTPFIEQHEDSSDPLKDVEDILNDFENEDDEE